MMSQVVYCLVVLLSAAVLAWTKTSASVVAVGDEMVDATLVMRLMPDALAQLLDSEPWLQIAGRVSETKSYAHRRSSLLLE